MILKAVEQDTETVQTYGGTQIELHNQKREIESSAGDHDANYDILVVFLNRKAQE